HRTVFPGSGQVLAPEEWQANRFAIALLVDAGTLRREFVERFGAPAVAWRSAEWRGRARTLRQHSRLLASNESQPRVPSLASIFGLSVEAMAIALEERGYSILEPTVF